LTASITILALHHYDFKDVNTTVKLSKAVAHSIVESLVLDHNSLGPNGHAVAIADALIFMKIELVNLQFNAFTGPDLILF
jgi:hypothetical protein